MTMLQGPVLNINGTHKDELLEEQRAVRRAADALIAALDNAAPNGRDYQTVEPERYTAAREQWQARMQMAIRIRQDADLLATSILYAGKVL